MNDYILNGILGFAVGDALARPAHGRERESLKFDPVLTMRKGLWTDNTSLTLCVLSSLRVNEWQLDYHEVMRRFCKCFEYGYMTQEGVIYDIDATVKQALQNYLRGLPPERCAPSNEWNCGSGSLAHILPIEFYLYKYPEVNRYEIIRNVSMLTHAHICCTLGCYLYLAVADEIIKGRESFKLATLLVRGITKAVADLQKSSDANENNELHYYSRIIDHSVYNLSSEEIENSGYIVDTLEAAFWCLANTASYRECMLWAANLGGDADTVAAVTGGLAGLYYGYESIPREWLTGLKNMEMIVRVCG